MNTNGAWLAPFHISPHIVFTVCLQGLKQLQLELTIHDI